ncbi:MAG: alpha/beta hydrolase [Chloracidobacterium sp.]|nr:alpha/beta hydrolase [Chloracidobacterium sp.]
MTHSDNSVLHKFGSHDALISDEEAPADRPITERRFGRRSAVRARRIPSLVMTLTLACVLSSGVGASDGEYDSKSNADSPDSAGLEDCYIEIEETKIHVVQGGTGQQTVVMIHGNAGDVQDFEYGVAELLSKSSRVIGFDRPGHGKSARPGGKAASVEDQSRMLHEALQNLGVKSAILLGHSWGASLALCYAQRYPAETAGLVLLAPAAFPDTDPNPLLRAVVKTPLIGELTLMFAKTLMGGARLRHELERAFYPQPAPENYLKIATSTWLGRKQLRAYLEDEWSLNNSLRGMSGHYSELRMPVVIVTGDRDQIVSPKENAYRLKEAIPQARLLELKGAGHEIPLTNPDDVYSALKLISTE